MSLADEDKNISKVVADEFDYFALEGLEGAYCSSYNPSAEGDAHRFPVDEYLLNTVQEFHRMVRARVFDVHEHPKANQRFCRGGLRKQLL
ncbi:MAG: hypothetical protein ACRC1I_17625 [Pseudomonas proteolytica]|uniref:hypothetical protein n=1 Tax=Pseudomonas proteolytica TaxID=219574 RepID=UPI003F3710B6